MINRIITDLGLLSTDPPPVRYIELWNEPDGEAYHTSADYFGCWIKDVSKTNSTPPPYDAGAYYPQVLNAIALYVKGQFLIPGTQNSHIKFVAGAVSDPQGGFIDSVIDNTISNIDVVSYRKYVNTFNSYRDIPAFINQQESCFTYVRTYLNNHNGSSKPIIISVGTMGYVP